MSSYNSFYRYLIEGNSDLLVSCYNRRKQKALHNHKLAFFFEIFDNEATDQSTADFLSDHLTTKDIVFVKSNKYESLKTAISILPDSSIFLVVSNNSDLEDVKKLLSQKSNKNHPFLFLPKTKSDLKDLVDFYIKFQHELKIFWRFLPYDSEVLNSLTLADINSFKMDYPVLPGLEIYNIHIPKNYELQPHPENPYSVRWSFKIANSNPILSIIIPTYNNALFLSNVVWHLFQQKHPKQEYEVIIADDGSQDNSCEVLQELFAKYSDQFNLKYIYWPKQHPDRGNQFFFRSGLARNLGTRYSTGEYLLFLDSDMIVPKNFVETTIAELKKTDIIQFQRFHINQELSKKNPSYDKINVESDTYIEEKNYWSMLFFCERWSLLPQYWKFTCTYALGIKRKDFLDIGMFKKYYISYGFEDTDLGYEAHKRNLKFELIKLPLLHLTAYDQMQYKNSFSKRTKLLKVTAELFYLQHLDKEIYTLLGDYYRMQKPFKALFRDFFSKNS